MKKNIVLGLILFLGFNSALSAKEYKIKSAKDLEVLHLKPGDKVIMQAGEWKDQQLVFKGTGTKNQPVTLTSATPGSITLSGNSSLKIDGAWLVVDGLSFANGYIDKGDVVLFSTKSTWCRLTNTAIVEYNNPDKTADYRWISMNGFNNRVDHCFIKGKSHQGVTLTVWLSDKPNYHRIDHNYFGERPELGGNGGETLRIGNSTWSLHDSKTIIENNIFEYCDGELEAVSIKSCKNIIRNNLFYECKATLTLRHGNNSEVYGNYFIGNNKPGTGGIRIIAEGHNVHDNYLHGITGKSVSAAISIMAGLPNPELKSHWQVKNASIINNLIINATEPFSISAGYNPGRYLPPLNTIFSKNVIVTEHEPLKWNDNKVEIEFKDNLIVGNSAFGELPRGFAVQNIKLKKDQNGLYLRPDELAHEPFWKTEAIGPSWEKGMTEVFKIE